MSVMPNIEASVAAEIAVLAESRAAEGLTVVAMSGGVDSSNAAARSKTRTTRAASRSIWAFRTTS